MVQGTAGAARFASSNTTNNSSINTTNNNSSSNTTNINHSSRDTTRSQKKCCATVPSQRRSTQAESNGNVQIWINAGWKPARPYQAESFKAFKYNMEESNHNVPGGGWFKLERFRGRIVMKRIIKLRLPCVGSQKWRYLRTLTFPWKGHGYLIKLNGNGFRRGFETVNFIIN